MKQHAELPAKIRVTNVTKTAGGAGHFLDPGESYGNKIIAPGHSMFFECKNGMLPDCVEAWVGKNYVRVEDAKSGTQLAGPVSGELSPGQISPVREMVGSQDDDVFGEDDFDLADAREAILPGQLASENTRPISGDLTQQSRARVSLGSREDEVVGGELSPIPGDRPRSLDDSDRYTIKAPRSHSVGAVIGKK